MDEIPRNLLLKAKLKELRALAEEEKQKAAIAPKEKEAQGLLKIFKRV